MTRIRRRAGWHTIALVVALLLPGVSSLRAMGAGEILGIVFHDIAGDALLDGAVGGSTNPGIVGATVRVFHDDGSDPGNPDSGDTELIGPFTTGADGSYAITDLADGDYWVAVDSTTLGASGWAEQTWGPSGAEFGGRAASVSDNLAGGGLAAAEHLALVSVTSAPVAGIDFGFSYNVVTRTGGGGTANDNADSSRSVQGTLRQFLTNAAVLSGPNTMRFVPVATPTTVDAGPQHQIVVTAALPDITDDGTTVDGTVYLPDGSGSDPNPGGVAAPAAAGGVDGLAAPATARPDLAIVGSGVGVGLDVNDAANTVIRGLTVAGFSDAGIRVRNGSSNTTIEDNVIGGETDPGTGNRNGFGIELAVSNGGTIEANRIGYNGSSGVDFAAGADGWTVLANDVVSNGLENTWADQLRLSGGSGQWVEGNHVRDGRQMGVEIRVAVGPLTIVNNTIDGNGVGGNEVAGIRNINSGAVPMTVDRNVITGNTGPGVLISEDGSGAPAPSLMTITGNRFGGNGGLAIDLTTSSGGRVAGDGPNSTSASCGTGTDANGGIAPPAISAAYAAGVYDRIVGTGCPGATVELYTAAPDGDGSDTSGSRDYGEPIVRILTATVAGDGTFDVFAGPALAAGDIITGLQTDPSGNTSEPSANATVVAANIPIITVLGDDPLTAEAGVAYTDPGATATDVEDGDLTASIVVDDPVDPDLLGDYTVTYDVTDSMGFPAETATRAVTVADSTAPVLTLIGPANSTFEGGSPYIDPGATATDSFEGDLTDLIVVTGTVDPFTAGPYAIGYSVADSSGNTAGASRTVTVVDTTAPTLTVLGGLSPVVPQHTTYVDRGATATDLVDGDLTSSIVVTGAVDTAVRGTYLLHFDVSDAEGNAAPTVTRTVVVADPNPPTIALIGPSVVSVEAFDPWTDPGATAFDVEDGDLTDAITTHGAVDLTDPGTYTLVYRVADESGNQAVITRSVRVVDTTPPTVSLTGETGVEVVAGHPYVEQGATATDLVDGDLTSSIVVTGTVDTALPATFTLTYAATDSAGNSASVTRTITVTPNLPPDVGDDRITVDQGATIAVAAPGLLANDYDPEKEPLLVSLASGADHGTVVFDRDGSYSYSHDGTRHDRDGFTYEVRDSYGNRVIGVVTVDVILQNRRPVAVDDSAAGSEDTIVVVAPLTNDSDPDGDPLTLVSAGSVDGHVRVSGDTLEFTPPADWSGSTTIYYTISDGRDRASAAVTVTIAAVNDTPTAGADDFEITGWDPLVLPVLDNDADRDGDPLAIGAIGQPDHGSVTLTDGGIRYQPRIGYWGPDRFTYTVADESGASATGTVTLTISRPGWVGTALIDGGGALLAAAPEGLEPVQPPEHHASRAEAIVLFVGAFLHQLLAESVHLALLLLALLWFILFGYSQWRRAATRNRRYAVVLLDREERLEVLADRSTDAECIHRFDAAERRIVAAGRARRSDGIRWLPVEVGDSVGWVDQRHLTEDAARSTFEREYRGLLDRLQDAAREGRPLEASSRGAIHPCSLERVVGDIPLAGDDLSDLREALLDPGAEILVDRLLTPDALRPAQLRNFHWITVATDRGAWHLYFEFQHGRPMLVTARREGAPLPRTRPVGAATPRGTMTE